MWVSDERDDGAWRALAFQPLQLARAALIVKAAPDPSHPVADHPAVGLDLRFAGTAEEAETAALALEVGPAAHQTPRLIIEMRKLDLQAALGRRGELDRKGVV